MIFGVRVSSGAVCELPGEGSTLFLLAIETEVKASKDASDLKSSVELQNKVLMPLDGP